MRSSPVYTEADLRKYRRLYNFPWFPSTAHEIWRIGMIGCRITFAGKEDEASKLFGLGPIIESGAATSGLAYWVISMLFEPGPDD